MLSKNQIPPLTASSAPATSDTGPAESHNYLLIKNVAGPLSAATLAKLLPAKASFGEIIKIPDSNHIYIAFKSLADVERIVAASEAKPVFYLGRHLRMCLVNKLPLDLNLRSSILLLTIYHEKIAINVRSLMGAFHTFGPILKMIVFKKKNYQALVEFDSADDAAFFKQALNGQNVLGLFTLKIQFTQKQLLVVNVNSEFEFDASKAYIPPVLDGAAPPFFPGSPRRSGLPRLAASSPHFFSEEKRPVHALLTPETQELSAFGSPKPKRRAHTAQRLLFDEEEDLRKLEDAFFCHSDADGERPPSLPALRTSVDEMPAAPDKSPVIQVDNVAGDLKAKHLFNLFSLYGTIEKIMLDSPRRFALIKFCTEFEAITSMYYLNNARLFGRDITIQVLDAEPPAWPKDRTQVYNPKLASGDPTARQRTINRPCATLYLFNLSKSITLDFLRKLVETKEPVVSLSFLNESRNSALCVLKSEESAIRALCWFKNLNLLDKSLKINFANETLVKSRARPDGGSLRLSDEDQF